MGQVDVHLVGFVAPTIEQRTGPERIALAALIKNGPLWQELRASLLKTITRKENVFISWVMRLLIVVSFAWTGWAITLVFYLLTVIAFWMIRNQIAQQVAA